MHTTGQSKLLMLSRQRSPGTHLWLNKLNSLLGAARKNTVWGTGRHLSKRVLQRFDFVVGDLGDFALKLDAVKKQR